MSLRDSVVRLVNLFRREQLERELDRELQGYLDLDIEESIRRGMAPQEARRTALARLGGVEMVKERCRDVWRFRVVDELWRSLRYGFRRLPSFAGLVIVATLAAALGVNAAMLAMFDALVIRPFQATGLAGAVFVSQTRPNSGRRDATSALNFGEWQRQARTLASLSAFNERPVEVGRDEDPLVLRAAFVSPELMQLAGTTPSHGRLLAVEDDSPGRHRVAVLSESLWRGRFGADPAIVGRPIVLDDASYEVVGVAPASFDFPAGTELWAPLALPAIEGSAREIRNLGVIARLAPDATLAAARAEMAELARELARTHPEHNANRDVRVEPLTAALRDEGLGPVLGLAQLAGLMVLLIACANIGNLLIALGVDRQREIAIRLALGATRAGVSIGLWAEAVVLAIISIPLALGVAWAAIGLITSSTPAEVTRFVPGWSTIGLDGRLVAATIALALLAAAFFGLLPAIQASRATAQSLPTGRALTADPARLRLRRALLVSQVALVLPLLMMAAVSSRGASRYLYGPQGYEAEGVFAARINLPLRRYPDLEARDRFATAVVDRVKADPNTQSAAFVNAAPASGFNPERFLAIEERPVERALRPSAAFRAVSPEYFETMRIPISRGRGFSDADRADTLPVAVISQSMAERFWPDADPLGRRFRSNPDQDSPWVTVVGVSGDVIHDWFLARNVPTFYRPYAQEAVRNHTLVVRVAANASGVARQMREAIRDVDPTRPVDLLPMPQMLGDRMVGLRQVTMLMVILGALALMLGALGLYGVISHFVSQRRQEILIRGALGATRRNVLALIFRQVSRLMGTGITLGMLFAAAGARTVQSAMFGVASLDLVTLSAAVLIVAAVGGAAGFLPARRALGMPVAHLLHE